MIARAEVFRVPHPVVAVRAHGIGEIRDAVETVILRLEADGVVGWGEAAPWAPFAGTPEASFAALARYLAPAVRGWRPGGTGAAMAAADRLLAGHPDAKAALETAFLDLDGRLTGRPMWAVLGGTDRVPVDLSISIADPDWARDEALVARAHGAGVRLFKLKAGFADHPFDVRRIEAIRAAFPEARLRLDYNQGLDRARALRDVPALDNIGLDFIEQPVAARDWATMADLRARLRTPLLADESVFDRLDLELGIARRIAGGLSVKIAKAGGPARGLALARAAEAAGWRVYGGDMFETGISHLAGLHMLTALGGCAWGCEFYHANWHLERDVLATRFAEKNGTVTAPEGPGLGQEVDEAYIRSVASAVAEID